MASSATPGLRSPVRLTRIIAPAIFCALIAFHFAALILWNLPPNPVRFAFADALNAYVMPMFYQNWSFFAPEPVDRDVYLLARGQRADGSLTEWFNVSKPFIQALQHNRLSSKELIVTGLSNSMLDSLRDHNLEALLRDKDGKALDEMQGPHILYRLAAASLARRYRGASFAKVTIAIEQIEFPRFTHRFETAPRQKPEFLVFPARPWPKDVMEISW